jgi:hypothetical protein
MDSFVSLDRPRSRMMKMVDNPYHATTESSIESARTRKSKKWQIVSVIVDGLLMLTLPPAIYIVAELFDGYLSAFDFLNETFLLSTFVFVMLCFLLIFGVCVWRNGHRMLAIVAPLLWMVVIAYAH